MWGLCYQLHRIHSTQLQIGFILLNLSLPLPLCYHSCYTHHRKDYILICYCYQTQ